MFTSSPQQCSSDSNAQGITQAHAADRMVDLTLIIVLTILKRRRRSLLVFAVIGTCVGIVLSTLIPITYKASTTIMSPYATPSALQMLANQSTVAGSTSLAAMATVGVSLKNPNDIYLGLLNSRVVADALISQFALASIYRSKDMTAAREKLAKHTGISANKSGFIVVSFTARDRKLAADVANAYIEQLRSLTRTIAATEASARRRFYEEQIGIAKEDVVRAELALQVIQIEHGIVELDAQAKSTIAEISNLQARIAAKRVELDALRSYATERNAGVQTAEIELASLQAEFIRLEGRRGGANDDGALNLRDVSINGLNYLRAEQEFRYRQLLLELLIKQADAARIDEGKEATVIQVVEPAIEPDRRDSPHRLLVICISIAGGVFVGLCYVLFVPGRKV